MLIQFSVENFLSFRDEVTFSMVAVRGDQQHPTHIVVDALGSGKSLLRAAAIYGANAAGKSNLIQAVRFAQDRITRGTRSGQSIPVRVFRLSAHNEARPSKFEFVIKHHGVQYTYGFRLDATRIMEEWLFARPNKQEVPYFQRITSVDNQTHVEFGPSFTGRDSKQKQFLGFVAKGTRPNQLFLTEAADRNVAAVQPVNEWFKDALFIIPADARNLDLEFRAHASTSFTEFVGSFLRTAGTGIDGIATEEVPLDFDVHLPDLPQSVREDIIAQIPTHEKEGFVAVITDDGDPHIIARGKNDQAVLIELKTKHRTDDGRTVNFTMNEESEGTQRLIHLMPALFSLKMRPQRVILVDELDRRLHPLLSRLLVQASLDCDATNSTAQLVFTTHDTSLLDLDLLRRDEIWFVEKDQDGVSHLYSLAEFKIRPDLKIEKGYLNGRFGAIPFIGNVCDLGWTDSEAPSPAKAGASSGA